MAGKLEERVKDIIVEQLGVNAEPVTPEASSIDDLGADSLDSVELIMAFEEEFGAASRRATATTAPLRRSNALFRRREQSDAGHGSRARSFLV